MPDRQQVATDTELDAFPASFGQERLWFLQRFAPESTVYNSDVSLRLRGELDPGALRDALGDLAARHETLRTTFRRVGAELRQVIHPPAPVRVDLVEASDFQQARTAARDAVRRRFDLEAGPLLRPTLVRLSERDHVLVVAFHHVVSDGWSHRILLRELGEAYASRLEGRPPAWEPLAIQYADFAAWQREALSGERLDALLDWWSRALAGVPEVLDLPTDRPRPPALTYRGDSVTFTVDRAPADDLEALGRRLGATPFMTLLAAFGVLLHRWTGHRDLVVGAPVAGRGVAEVEDLIGFFVNTLVMRVHCSGDPSFAEVVTRVRDHALGAFAHAELPFEALVDELGPERDPSHTPVVQVLFALQNVVPDDPQLPGLEAEPLELGTDTVPFDLTVELFDAPDGLEGVVGYSTDLFERSTVERLARSFVTLLEGVAEDPSTSVGRIGVLDAAERELVLGRWNATEADFEQVCVHRLVERAARAHPEAEALAWDGGSMTYAEMDAEADRLAAHLRDLGAGPDGTVCVVGDRCPQLVVAMLAAWKAGAAYVPLDPSWPPQRLRLVADDAGAAVVCAAGDVADVFGGRAVVRLGSSVPPAAAPDVEVHPSHLAYAIYTSGSTGAPKGVLVEHRNLANLLSWHARRFSPGPGDRIGWTAGPAFDASVWEVWSCLASGATLHVPDEATRANPVALRDWVVHRRLTMCFLATRLCERFLDERDWPPDVALRYLFCGGDKLTRRPHPALRFEVHDMYGPTECTVISSSAHVRAGPPGGPPPIGGPVANTRLYLLDPNAEPVPVGVVGELYVAGAGVSRGYLGRPDLTAERFVPDAFSGAPGARLYRTGDLARWLSDGQIEMRGRIDHQVKVRGLRVELGEVETHLADDPRVREAAVVVRDDRLVGYVVAANASVDADAVRERLRRVLPEYMVPTSYVVLDSLPTTSNGKLDRSRLPEVPVGSRGVTPPRTRTEREIADLWTRVLGVESVGVTEKFFDVGGTSLLIVDLFERIEVRWPGALTVADLFERTTVAEIAGAIDDRTRAVTDTGTETIEV